MEPHESKEPALSAPKDNETTALVPVTELTLDHPKPHGSRWLLLAGIGVAVVSLVVSLGFLQVKQTAPVETPPPVAVAPPPPAPEVESTPPPTWTGSQQTTWAHDGSKTVVFTLAATRDLPVWMSHARPALVVRCLYRRTEAFVALDTSTNYEDDADRRTVTVQWDNDAASSQRWGLSESGKELFAPDGVAIVRRLTTARHLRFGFSPFNASPVTAEFVVEGFAERALLVARTCGWRLDEPHASTE